MQHALFSYIWSLSKTQSLQNWNFYKLKFYFLNKQLRAAFTTKCLSTKHMSDLCQDKQIEPLHDDIEAFIADIGDTLTKLFWLNKEAKYAFLE